MGKGCDLDDMYRLGRVYGVRGFMGAMQMIAGILLSIAGLIVLADWMEDLRHGF